MAASVAASVRFEVETFRLDVPGEGEVIWNVASIAYMAEHGFIPGPFKASMAVMPPAEWSNGHLNRAKVDLFKTRPDILILPALAIGGAPRADGKLFILCFCDGSHRLTARQELGLPDFRFYLVPHTEERRFRIHPSAIVSSKGKP